MADLSLSKDEDDGIILEAGSVSQGGPNIKLCLIGRFLTDRPINFNAMKNRMASIWRPGKGICIKELGANLYLFQFFHEVDLNRIKGGGPWSFDNHLLILHQLEDGEEPSHVPLLHVDFWVQIFDLPVGFMSEHVGRLLGNFIGKFVEYDMQNNSSLWRTYMRIRVTIDVRLPLKRFKKIKKQGGDWAVVSFKYERLNHFCFICGLLGHTDRFCEKLFITPEAEIKREWGAWLRAPTKRNMFLGGERWLREEGHVIDDRNVAAEANRTVDDRRREADPNLAINPFSISAGGKAENSKFKITQYHSIPDDMAHFQELSPQDRGQKLNDDSEDLIMEINDERKRRRGLGPTHVQLKNMEMDSNFTQAEAHIEISGTSDPKNYFLLAGAGSQACQGP